MDDFEIEPRKVKEKLDRGDAFLLVDCREPHEHAICRIEGAHLVPRGSMAQNLALFESAEEVVVYCHHGRRSLEVTAWLRAQGVDNARSMAGGIERWSREIDPSVPRY